MAIAAGTGCHWHCISNKNERPTFESLGCCAAITQHVLQRYHWFLQASSVAQQSIFGHVTSVKISCTVLLHLVNMGERIRQAPHAIKSTIKLTSPDIG